MKIHASWNILHNAVKLPFDVACSFDFFADARTIVHELRNELYEVIHTGEDNVEVIIEKLQLKNRVTEYYQRNAVDPALIAMIIQIVIPIVIEILKVAIPLIIEAIKNSKSKGQPTLV